MSLTKRYYEQNLEEITREEGWRIRVMEEEFMWWEMEQANELVAVNGNNSFVVDGIDLEASDKATIEHPCDAPFNTLLSIDQLKPTA